MLFPALWLLAEWSRGWVMTGFPWLIAGYAQTDSPLAGWAPLVGVYGLGMAAAQSAALLGAWPRLDRRGRSLALLLLLILWAGGAALRAVDWTLPLGAPLNVALVQPYTLGEDDDNIDQWQRYVELTRDSWQHSDLVVWPETAVSVFAVPLDQHPVPVDSELPDPQIWTSVELRWDSQKTPVASPHHIEEHLLGALEDSARADGKTVLLGAELRNNLRDRIYNGLLALGGDARALYNKRHLVPFGEFIPLDQSLRPFWDWLQVYESNFAAGRSAQPLLPAAGYLAATAICYESAFGEELIEALPEAAFLVVVGNDGMFDGTDELDQHLQIVRMRALETGRWVARATKTGLSALIAPDGEVAARSPVNQTDVLYGQLQPRTGLTPLCSLG